MNEEQRIQSEVRTFLANHLDYKETERNADLIAKWLELKGLAISVNSLHAAYQALHDSLDVYSSAPIAPTPQPIPIPNSKAPQGFRNGRPIELAP